MSDGNSFDVIVLGAGTMGSATCFQLAQRGVRVLALEQFSIVHERGAHAGQSRIIRKAYFEHPDYVPLLERAYRNWKELEVLCGQQVYFPTGLLYAGPADHPSITGVQTAASLYEIPLSSYNENEAGMRFPQFSLPPHFSRLYEPDAGLLTPERAIRLFCEEAKRRGAIIKTETKVEGFEKKNGQIVVSTATGQFQAPKLVITAGPWAGQSIPSLKQSLQVTRQVLAWLRPPDPEPFRLGNFPCWTLGLPGQSGIFYGFPILSGEAFGQPDGLKLALHAPGLTIDPDATDRGSIDGEVDQLLDIARQYLPRGLGEVVATKTCLYSNSPDEHFILDFLPEYDNQVVYAAGFSGHGFKFASAIGEIMADLALNGATSLPIGFLSANRF